MEFLSKMGNFMGNLGGGMESLGTRMGGGGSLASMGNEANYSKFIQYFNSLPPEEQKRLLMQLSATVRG